MSIQEITNSDQQEPLSYLETLSLGAKITTSAAVTYVLARDCYMTARAMVIDPFIGSALDNTLKRIWAVSLNAVLCSTQNLFEISPRDSFSKEPLRFLLRGISSHSAMAAGLGFAAFKASESIREAASSFFPFLKGSSNSDSQNDLQESPPSRSELFYKALCHGTEVTASLTATCVLALHCLLSIDAAAHFVSLANDHSNPWVKFQLAATCIGTPIGLGFAAFKASEPARDAIANSFSYLKNVVN